MMLPWYLDPVHESNCVISPEFLRTVRDRVLLVPRLLGTHNRRASLHVASTGKGHRYHLLRLSPTFPIGENSKELFYYMGRLTPHEFKFVAQLIADHQRLHVHSGPKHLRLLKPDFNVADEIWQEAKSVASYAATLAGFGIRDYRVHKSRTVIHASAPPQLLPTLRNSTSSQRAATFQELHQTLQVICTNAPGDPLQATLNALKLLEYLGWMICTLLLEPLAFTFQDRSISMLTFRICRWLTKAEERAIAKRNKYLRILDAISESQIRLEAEVSRKWENHENR